MRIATWGGPVLALCTACGGATLTASDAGTDSPSSPTLDASVDGGPIGEAGAPDAPFPPPAIASKVDLLFMIDNSASMGDKQELLRLTVPDLLGRFLNPSCVDAQGNVLAQSSGGKCAQGQLEFLPVTDMHIGIVSSSLGGLGADQCTEPTPNPVNGSVDTHNNDRGELLNRSDPQGNQTETPLGDANPAHFLAWFPPVASNQGAPSPAVPPLSDPNQLANDFQNLIAGVHQYGCGFEAQDESWYRFLVQPDPYDHVSRDKGECTGGGPNGQNTNQACFVGVDKTILQQRHDFLRPDSLVVVIMLTDENSGEAVDPLAIGGQGWAYMDDHFPGGSGPAASGTSACGPTPVMGANPGPNDPNCTSCGFGTAPGDPNCQANGGFLSAADDSINTRGVYDKQRFGVDPRYPVSRYVNGLTSSSVPDRAGEHSGGNYVGNNDCTNPLFATNLPTDPGPRDASGNYPALCNLPRGPRTPNLVFLVAITGVPHELLQVDPSNPDSPQKASLSPADWTKLLGKDPEKYDYTGIDPHMFVSIGPRQGLPPPGLGNGTDPIHGRDWNTQGQDQQYACTFALRTPKDCTQPANVNACDCGAGRCDACAGNPSSCSCPPLCDPNNPTLQIKAKAYPAPRELEEVKGMGAQGVVSSLCPIHVTESAPGDPLYGYRPAAKALGDAIRPDLAH